MNKLPLLLAIAAITVLPASCDKNDPASEQGQNTTPVTPVTPNNPTPQQKEIPKPENMKITVTDKDGSIKTIEMTVDGKYILAEVKDKDKGREYSTGEYTINSDGNYVLSKDGTLTLTVSGSSATFSLKKNDGTTVTGSATITKPNAPSSTQSKLCKVWTITKTRVSITDGVKANADFSGCDLGEIEDFAKKQGIEINRDFKDVKVNTITVTPMGTVMVALSNGVTEVADCDISTVEKDGEIKYKWPDVSPMGYTYSDGTAKITFQGDNVIMAVEAKFTKESKNYTLAVTFVLAVKN
ncbi:MAG: hypothetical protein IJK05_01715 [Bacteroidales bacterium]|nr:hypothetical protein [Bacteroidales bacterium]